MSLELWTLSPTNITSTSATMRGSYFYDGYTSVTLQIRYVNEATGAVSTVSVRTLTGPEQGTYSINVTGLTPGTGYAYRAVASNGVEAGSRESFVTLLNSPSVGTNAATNITQTSATMNGNLTNKGGTSAIVSTGFQWRVQGGTYTSVTVSTNANTGSFSSGLSGLTAGTTYEYRAWATNQNGTSYGSTTSFTTQSPPPPAPTGLNLIATSNVINLTWNSVSGASQYRVYRDGVHYATTSNDFYADTGAGAPWISGGTFTVSTNNASAIVGTVSGASANDGTQHTYYVTAVVNSVESGGSSSVSGRRTAGGLVYTFEISHSQMGIRDPLQSSTSSTVSVTSAETQPTGSPPSSVTVDNATVSSLRVNWSGASASDGPTRWIHVALNATGCSTFTHNSRSGYRPGSITGYVVHRSGSSGGTYFNVSGNLSSGTSSWTNSNLFEGTTYFFRVAVKISGRDDILSTAIGQGTTLVGPTPTPTGLTATNSNNHVALSWSFVTDASSYKVYRDGVHIGSPTGTSFNDTGAGAPSINQGTLSVSTNSPSAINANVSGASTSNGTLHSYTVSAIRNGMEGSQSSSVNGRRVPGSLTYRFEIATSQGGAYSLLQDSASNSASESSSTTQPSGTAPSTITVTDATASSLRVNWSGATASNGPSRWIRCILSADGCTSRTHSGLEGYRTGVLTGYIVHRSTTAGGTYTAVSGVLTSSTSSWTNSGLPVNTTYFYKVAVQITSIPNILSTAYGQGKTLTTVQRPSFFAWTYPKISGANFYLHHTEWNALLTNINEVRAYKGLSTVSFNTASTDQEFSATLHYNPARSAIAAMSPPTPLPASKQRLDDVAASLLNGLRDSLNSIT